MAELPAGAVTFLFTDIEGSTQLVKQLRDAYPQVLAEHRGLLREAFAAHDGHEIDTQGDAFFVAFASARDAVLAAVEGQGALAKHPWPDGAQVRVRIGVHTGQASPTDGRYTGVAVHRAARISAAGHGGQILISQTTHHLLEDEEEDIPGVDFVDLGEHQLKDLDRPVRLYQVSARGLEREFPPPRTAAPAPAAAPEQPYYRRRSILVGALAGVIAAAVAIPIFALGGGSPGGAVAAGGENAVGVIDGASGEARGAIRAPATPTAVAAGLGYVWVASADANMVYALDPETRTVRDQIPLEGAPGGIATGGGYVWVTNSLAGTVSQIDPESFTVLRDIPVGNGPTGVAFGGGHVWVANTTDHTVSRVDIRTGESAEYRAGADPSGIAVDDTFVWVASKSTGTVVKLSLRGAKAADVSVGNAPSAVAVGAGSVWVANNLDGTVSRIDPERAAVVGLAEVGGTPSGLAVAGNRVWVTNDLEGTVAWVDPATVEATLIRVGGRPTAIAAGGDDVYVGLRPGGSAHRGGTLRVLASAQESFSVDPAIAYEEDLWRIVTLTNDGLLTYRRVSGQPGSQLVPDLAAAMPVVSEDGRTYTFQLRPGIRYSTGEVVKASDVRSSLERVFVVWPHGNGALAEFFGGLVGASACRSRGCDLSRAIVTDDSSGTVTIHLKKADAAFLYKLALPFSSVLPKSTPRKRNLRRAVPATGPYRVDSVVEGRSVRLVRNPRFHEWSSAAQPAGFPDRIDVTFLTSDQKGVAAVADGKADLASSGPFDTLSAQPALRSQLRRNPQAATFYFALNASKPPFDDPRARRAVNYAIDRNRIVRLSGEDAAPTCQVLPPNFPGYRRYCPYTLDANTEGTWTAPDLSKALDLVAASGSEGDDVTLVFPSEQARVGRYIRSVLDSLGFRVHVKTVGYDAYFNAVTAPSTQIAWTGWKTNYPSADNFIQPLFTCGSEANLGHFCDPRVDRQIERALEIQSRDPAAANLLWEKVDHEVTRRAAWLALYNLYGADLISKRVGNYQYNPQYGAILSQMWVR